MSSSVEIFMKSVVVFGCGTHFLSCQEVIYRIFNVVALCDNDTDKQSRGTEGQRIISVKDAMALQYDFFLITSDVYAKDMFNELILRGIDPDKILRKTICNRADLLDYIDFFDKLKEMNKDNCSNEKLSRMIFSYDDPFSDPPNCSPLSDDYRSWVLNKYEVLSGRSFNQEINEDIDSSKVIYDDNVLTNGWHGDIANLMPFIEPGPTERICELGCGGGHLLTRLAGISSQVVGVDISDNMLKHCAELLNHFGLDAKLVKGDFFEIENMTGQFDLVLMHTAFHHCLMFPELLCAMAKKLNDNGRVILANEPIYDYLGFELPYDLGSDISVLYWIGKKGYFDLQISEKFFLEACGFAGLRVRRKFYTNAYKYKAINYELVKMAK